MNHKISAIILAGGQGQRFNYQDKGLITWKGLPLITHVINRIEPQVEQVIINCNRNIEDYQLFGYALCQDKMTQYQGPLAGIQSALSLCQHPFSLICPCDTPELPRDIAATLLSALLKNNAEVAYPNTHTRAHYLPALIKNDLLTPLNTYLKGKDRSMKGWYSTLKEVRVEFATTDNCFLNLNTPDML